MNSQASQAKKPEKRSQPKSATAADRLAHAIRAAPAEEARERVLCPRVLDDRHAHRREVHVAAGAAVPDRPAAVGHHATRSELCLNAS